MVLEREEGEANATNSSVTGDVLPTEESTPNRPSRSRCERATAVALVAPFGSGGFVAIRAL
jgi:hypothetical protein